MSLYLKISLLFAFWCIAVLLYYIPNMGGSGLRLPQNLMTWGVMAALVAAVFHDGLRHRVELRLTASFWYVLGGGFLLSVPLFWTARQEWQSSAVMRVIGIWGAVVFFLCLLQIPLNSKKKRVWLVLLLAASLGQIAFACLQLFYPQAITLVEFNRLLTRPFGIFQQPNLLASFLATGFLISLRLLTTTLQKAFWWLLCISLMLHSAWLVAIQSRIGWLGALAGTLIYGAVYFRRRRFLLALLMAMLSALASWLMLPDAIPVIERAGSNATRLLTLEYTLQMIAERPWLGWGYGSFEHEFIRYAIGSGLRTTMHLSRITHPHNEVLYAWAEGGIIALIGMLLLFFGWLRLASILNKKRTLIPQYLVWVLTLPVVLHTMTEYPLYQSAPHILILLVICRLVIPERDVRQCGNGAGPRILYAIVLVASVATVHFMLSGLQTNSVLTRTERNRLEDFSQQETRVVNTLAQGKRLDYDRHVRLLLDFNESRDVRSLKDFQPWAERYLQVHNDANVYWSLIRVLQIRGDMRNAALYRSAAQFLFPQDDRFK